MIDTSMPSAARGGFRREANMRMVVDSNYLQKEKLRSYLAASTDNYAVLTEYAAMEAYKGDTLASIYHSMGIVADYPKQIIVLRGTQLVCGLTGCDAALQEPLIDEIQTREFPEYCHHLLAAKRGNLSLQQQLLQHGREATTHMERLLQDMSTISSAFDLMAKTYSPAELKVLRRRDRYTLQTREKLIQDVCALAALLFKNHPSVTKQPKVPEIRDMFLFRYALVPMYRYLRGYRAVALQKQTRRTCAMIWLT
jgi:hypothetical protein